MLERAPYSPQLVLFEFSSFHNLEIHSKKPIFNQPNKSIRKQITFKYPQTITSEDPSRPGSLTWSSNIALGGYCLKGIMHRYNNFINKALY